VSPPSASPEAEEADGCGQSDKIPSLSGYTESVVAYRGYMVGEPLEARILSSSFLIEQEQSI